MPDDNAPAEKPQETTAPKTEAARRREALAAALRARGSGPAPLVVTK